jgi:hypothetical protein
MLLHLHSRPATISRPGSKLTGIVRAAPSNYFRNLQGPSDSVFHGREFVISKAALDVISYGPIKRGDRLTFSDIGVVTINEPIELYDLGGAIMGYRVRTN